MEEQPLARQAPEDLPVPDSVSPPLRGEVLGPARASTGAEARISVEYSGPIPDPNTYRQLAEIIPNGAERIMRMAEKQQDAAIRVRVMEEGRATWGVVFAFVLGLAGFGTGMFAIMHEAAATGAVAIIGTLAALAGVFIRGTSTRQLPASEETPPAPTENESE